MSFVVVDLWSQGESVSRYVAGWPRTRILSWLSTFGRVREGSPPGSAHAFFIFEARCGLTTVFWFGDERWWVLSRFGDCRRAYDLGVG